MIVISDLHLKDSTSFYFVAQQKLLNYFQENFNTEIIVFLGDIFDTSSPHWESYFHFITFLKSRKNKTFILQGNHDFSKRKGSLLKGLSRVKDVEVFLEEKEILIQGYKILMLPYQYNMGHYEDINFAGDLCFCHFTPEEEIMFGDCVRIPNVKALKIFGHIHVKADYPNVIIPGVPLPTRNLEVSNSILKIKENLEIEEIEVPEFLKIVTIEYGEEAPNKDWIYNVVNAPSFQNVYDLYKGFNIRRSGIRIINSYTSDLQYSNENINSTIQKSIDDKYIEYSKEQGIDENYINIGLQYLRKSAELV